MKPQVSVILPTYNRRHLLPRAVASVQRQRDVLWQLVIIDDGSTDGSSEYLLALSQEDTNIVVISVDHRGQSPCRNLGLLHADADIVSYLDSDDEYKPDHLIQRFRYLQSHVEADVLYGGVEVVGPPPDRFVADVENPRKFIPVEECIIGGTFFGNKDAFLSVGGWEGSYGEDFRLYKRLTSRFTIHKVDFPTYIYHRDTKDSICSKHRK